MSHLRGEEPWSKVFSLSTLTTVAAIVLSVNQQLIVIDLTNLKKCLLKKTQIPESYHAQLRLWCPKYVLAFCMRVEIATALAVVSGTWLSLQPEFSRGSRACRSPVSPGS